MTGLESYVNALETARQTFFEMDDALGQLSCAIDVIEALTEGHIASKATNPLHHNYRRLCEALSDAWPTVVKAAPSLPDFGDDLFHEGATVFMGGKSYVLGKYHPEIKAWDLYHGGENEITLRADILRRNITGIKFKEAS
ncbi:hypothetical protein QBD01_003544 [Ochrobactrum sp. 19YEA23]|uniref:hypothetical protein n=1 Tax=Ochrobactrum sp. 19YEA23 TaxID=3039854 RepID=UPI002478E670|nr:hypothetical protein [Ochrobactrum sp. 19YEA23]